MIALHPARDVEHRLAVTGDEIAALPIADGAVAGCHCPSSAARRAKRNGGIAARPDIASFRSGNEQVSYAISTPAP
jgi:hypothetical protein